MENATKALLIVAGVLIGVMILSLGAALFLELENYVQVSNEKIEANAQNAFNTQFTKYINNDLKIHDVITAANLAYENNMEHNPNFITAVSGADPSQLFVAVYLDGERIDNQIANPGMAADLLEEGLKFDYTYACTADDIIYSEITGRIYEVHFSTN